MRESVALPGFAPAALILSYLGPRPSWHLWLLGPRSLYTLILPDLGHHQPEALGAPLGQQVAAKPTYLVMYETLEGFTFVNRWQNRI